MSVHIPQDQFTRAFFDYLHEALPSPPTIWDKWKRKLDLIEVKLTNTVGAFASHMICTVLKVIPIGVILLILPTSIVFGMFAITAVVTIIKPELFFEQPSLTAAIGHSMGSYSALQAIWNASAISFSATPQLCLVATFVHLIICAASFNFSKYIACEKRRKIVAAQMPPPSWEAPE